MDKIELEMLAKTTVDAIVQIQREEEKKRQLKLENPIYPQKLGLDVVIDSETGNFVTLEINGQYSGYQGLKELGTDLSEEITKIICEAIKPKLFRKRKILMSPHFLEFNNYTGKIENIEQLRKAGIEVDFSPILKDPISRKRLEGIIGRNLRRYDCLMGLSKLKDYSAGWSRMINTTKVEFIEEDKQIQYELFKDIPGFNMPDTHLTYRFPDPQGFRELAEELGTFVMKDRYGIQGEGVKIIDEDNIEQFLKEILGTKYKYKWDLANAGIELKDTTLKGMQGLYDDEKTRKVLYRNPNIIQRRINTAPIYCVDTMKKHFARARLIWFDGYLGGYWGLSKEPVEKSETEDQVVNYSWTQRSQRFTPDEETLFRAYAENVVPIVIDRMNNITMEEILVLEDKLTKDALFSERRSFEQPAGKGFNYYERINTTQYF